MKNEKCAVFWPSLTKGTLLKRYKRFLADVLLESGETVAVHCPNSGAMTGCRTPGRPVYLSRHDSPKRKLKYTWQLIDMPSSLVGVNTMVTNRLAALSIVAGAVPELDGYDEIRTEVKVGKHSRLDLMLKKGENIPCYVEVKNCTLVENGRALFPDAVTSRGRKHLEELRKLVSEGFRCAMLFLIQRMDALVFSPADAVDPAYGEELRKAAASGVEILVYDTHIDLEKIVLNSKIPVEL
jgi:sugar fermentation stimulation protein A